jgi:prepilin-type processing-associated H-X9-DG protein
MTPHTVNTLVWLSHGSGQILPFLLMPLALCAVWLTGGRTQRTGVSRWAPRIASWAFLSVSLCVTAASFLHVGCAFQKGWDVQCLSNMKQIGVGLLLYEEDWDERMPPSANWYDGSRRYISMSKTDKSDVFQCPAAQSRASYGFNAALGGAREDQIEAPVKTVILFEADAPSRSFSGGLRDVAARRHGGVASNVVFADGHQKYTGYMGWGDIRWDPGQAPDARAAATDCPARGSGVQ